MDRFSPSRLTVARQRRGLTKKALAAELDVSAQQVTNYEKGADEPSAPVVERMLFALRVPRIFLFAEELEPIEAETVSFRSLRSISAGTRDRMLATGEVASAVVSMEFRRRHRLPKLDLPDLSGEEPELAAKILRHHWGLGEGPIENMVRLLEAKGIELYWINHPSNALDAVSFWRFGRPYVIVNTAMTTAGERGRLDVAHELAHLVLHRRIERLDERQIEREAFRMAGAFLMPEEPFRATCPRRPIIEEFLPHKRTWKVSIQAMVRRCKDLGVFSDWQYERACKDIAMRGERKQEQEPLAPEVSSLHAMIYDRYREKGITSEGFAQQIGLYYSDLEELTPVAERYRALSARGSEERSASSFLRLVDGGLA